MDPKVNHSSTVILHHQKVARIINCSQSRSILIIFVKRGETERTYTHKPQQKTSVDTVDCSAETMILALICMFLQTNHLSQTHVQSKRTFIALDVCSYSTARAHVIKAFNRHSRTLRFISDSSSNQIRMWIIQRFELLKAFTVILGMSKNGDHQNYTIIKRKLDNTVFLALA